MWEVNIMEENKLPDLMTVTEVAKVLRMTSQAIRDMIKRERSALSVLDVNTGSLDQRLNA